MKNSHKRRKRKGKVIWGFIGVLVLTAAIVFGLFRVNEISVSGNSTFTSAQIQQAILQDGLCQNTLYLMWKYSDKTRAEKALPFLSSVEVKMESPFKVQVHVYEKQAVGYVRTQGKYVYFDRTGLIIENSQKLHENVPEVTGLTLDKVTLYKNLTATDPDKLDTVIRVADLLNQEGLTPDEIR